MFTQSTPNALATLRNSVHSKSNSQTVTSTAVSSRLMFAALALATILSLKSEAQYPAPPAPTTYPYAEGTLIVSEGLVAVDSMDPTEDSQGYSRGQSAAVAITESLSGSARFIVTWESDGRWLLNVSGGTLNYRAVLANRFSAGGECVTWGACAPSGCGPKELSAYVNQGGRNCYNYFPSVAITGGGRVSSAWVGHRIGEGFGPVYSGETLVQLDAFQIGI